MARGMTHRRPASYVFGSFKLTTEVFLFVFVAGSCPVKVSPEAFTAAAATAADAPERPAVLRGQSIRHGQLNLLVGQALAGRRASGFSNLEDREAPFMVH